MGEAQVLRRIENVIRLGRVRGLQADRIVLDQGHVDVQPDTLFIDCTASAVDFRVPQPVFQGDRIVLQLLRLPQPAFSAALTAYVEAHYSDESHKNRLCGSVPFPRTLADYPRAMQVNMTNQYHWGQDKELRQWIRASRLDGFGKLMASADKQDAEKQAIVARYKEQAVAAMGNLGKLISASSSRV